MGAPNWGVPITTLPGPGGYVAYLAGAGGAPRVQVQDSRGTVVADFFAFEAAQRGGVTGAWGSDTNLYVMAGPGGGPVLKTFNLRGQEVAPGRFVGNPFDRRGFVPVPIDVVRVVERPVEKIVYVDRPVEVIKEVVKVEYRDVVVDTVDLRYGAWFADTHHQVFVNFEAGGLTLDQQRRTAERLYQRGSQFGPVALVTKRPDLYPGAYLELVLVPSLRFTSKQFPPNGAGGVNFSRVLIDDHNLWRQSAAWVSAEFTAPNPEGWAAALFHEWGHSYGWGYTHPGGDSPDNPTALAVIRPNVPKAAAIAARYRVYPPAPPPTGGVSDGPVEAGAAERTPGVCCLAHAGRTAG